MTRYIGLDVHSETTTAVVLGTTGKRLREAVLDTSAEVLRDFVRSLSTPRQVCLEEGAQSEWLHEVLAPHCERVCVVQVPAAQGQKSDRSDAHGLAERIRIGALGTTVFKPSGRLSELRQAVRTYHMAVADLTRAKNRLRALLRARGILPSATLYDPEQRATWLARLPTAQRTAAELLGAQVDRLAIGTEQARAWLEQCAGPLPEVRRLQTLPGVGRVRAATIVAVVVTPERFRTSRQFWSYCGLAIVTHESAQWERTEHGTHVRRPVRQTRGLTRRRNRWLKEALLGAAVTVIQQMPGHPLHAHYERLLAQKVTPQNARHTLARRLAAAALAIWKKQEDYDPARPTDPPTA